MFVLAFLYRFNALGGALGGGAPAEVLLDAESAGGAHGAAAGGVGEQSLDGIGEGAGIGGGDEDAGLAIGDHLREGASGRGDDGRSGNASGLAPATPPRARLRLVRAAGRRSLDAIERAGSTPPRVGTAGSSSP